MTTEIQRLGTWMEAARGRFGWTRDALYDASGVTPRSQQAIVNGSVQSVRASTIDGLARAFRVSPHDLRAHMVSAVDLPIPDPPRAATNSSPRAGSDVWDELTDLRRRVVEIEARLDYLIRLLDER